MIANGASRSNGAFFARHLLRADQNERVTVMELRGFSHAKDVREAFREMQDRAEGTGIKNAFYHLNLNTRADEHLTDEQWNEAIDAMERGLGLDGQQRLVVGHGKEGRDHVHVVWSRVYLEQVGPEPGDVIPRAISDSWNYRVQEEVATELEQRFGHEATARALTRDKETTPRPEPGMKGWEDFRAADTKIDPKAMRAELTELWQHSDSGPAFAAALEERGYILARGDRRDFCVIDSAGDEHSLGRRISGVKAAEIRSRMEDVDSSALPSVDEARALARQRQEEPQEGSAAAADATPAAPAEPVSPFDAALRETVQANPESPATAAEPVAAERPAEAPLPAFDTALRETARSNPERQAVPSQEEPTGGRFDRFRVWWGTAREYVTGISQQAREAWSSYFRPGEREPDAPQESAPSTTVAGPTPAPERLHNQHPGWGPEL